MTVSAINIQNVEYVYTQSNKEEKNTVLSIPNLNVIQGEKIFLYGNSGSGKTTLLNLLCGMLVPQSGVIEVNGINVSAMPNAKRDEFRAKNIGVVFQKFNLVDYLTVAKNIQLAAYFAKRLTNNLSEQTIQLIEALNLPQDIINKQVSNISVGQQQRVAIARALINQPKVLLVDEPTSALDASARDAFMKLLMQMCETYQITLVFVSHDKSLSHYFDRQINLLEINQPMRNRALDNSNTQLVNE